MLGSGQTEIHVKLGACIKDCRVGVAERHRLAEPFFQHAQSSQKQRANAILQREVLELAREPRCRLPTVGKDQRLTTLERRGRFNPRGLVEQLDADQFLEWLIPLGLVIHDLRAIGLAVGAVFEMTWLDVLAGAREPDFASIGRFRPDATGERIKKAAGAIFVGVETGVFEQNLDWTHDAIHIVDIPDILRPQKVGLTRVEREGVEICDTTVAAGMDFEHAGAAATFAR